jgi:hypothetical protein
VHPQRCLILLLLLPLAAVVSQAGPILCDTPQNMVVDCGFEDDWTWWQTGGNWQPANNGITDFVAHSGTYSVKLGNYPAQLAGVWHFIDTDPGKVYELSFWMYLDADNSTGGDLQLIIGGLEGQGVVLRNQPVTNRWTPYTTHVVGTGSEFDLLEFSGYSRYGYIYIDDAVLRDASAVAAPEPGAMYLLLSGVIGAALWMGGRGALAPRRVPRTPPIA